MRIVFMGTPAFAVPTLARLIASEHEVIAVYSQPPRPAGRGHKETPSPVHKLAEEHGIEVRTPESLKDSEVQAVFAALEADVAVVAAYGLLLPQPILEAFPHGCINVHPSLLPRWRGAAPIQRTIMAGDTETGVCIMQMDEGLDTGDVLLCEEIPVPEKATARQLHDTLAELGAGLVLKTLEEMPEPTPQPENGTTYANKINKEEAHISWDQPAQQIDCLIRGLNPYPGAYFIYEGERVKILEAEWQNEANADTPGKVVDSSLVITCNPGSIQPTLLQRQGKQPMGASEFLRGFTIPVSSILE